VYPHHLKWIQSVCEVSWTCHKIHFAFAVAACGLLSEGLNAPLHIKTLMLSHRAKFCFTSSLL
jgi:hypothetical protein